MRGALPVLVTVLSIPLVAQSARTDVPSLLPRDTLLHVEIDIEPMAERGHELALTRIMREPSMQRFLGPLQGALDAKLAELEAHIREAAGVGFAELKSLSSARITISLLALHVREDEGANVRGDDVLPDLVFTVDFGEALVHFRKALNRLEDVISADAGGAFEDVSISGRPVRHLPIPMAKGFGIYHALHGESLIITTTRHGMAGVLARLDTPAAGKTLGGDAGFRDIRKHVQGDHTVLWGWCDLKRLIGSIVSTLPEETRDAFALWGLDAYDGIGYGMELDGAGIRDRIYGRLEEENIWKDAYPGPRKLRTPDLLPRETGVYVAGLLDFGGAYDSLLKTLDDGYPRVAEEIRTVVDQIESELRVHLRDDLLGTLGPEYALYLAWPGQAVIPDVGLVLEVRENARPKIERIIDTVRAEVEGTVAIRKMDFRGHVVRWLDFTASAPPGVARRFGPRNMKPSFAFVGDWLVIAPWPQAIKNLIHGLETKKPRLRENPDFSALHARLSPRRDEASLFYVDLQGFTGFLLDNGIPLLQSLVPLPPEVPLELAAFPTTETVTRHMFGMMGVSHWTEGGAVNSEMYSPVGAVPTYLVMVGTIAATLFVTVSGQEVVSGPIKVGPGLAEQKMATDMQMLGNAVRAFRAWEGRLPKESEWPKFLVEGSENNPNPYVDGIPKDRWGRPFVYEVTEDGRFRILTYGRDGKPGGEGPDADQTFGR